MTPHSTDASLSSESGNAAMTVARLPPDPNTLAQLIESERVELLQVQAMLKCLYDVLLYADDDDSLMHADVANVCARLINDSACRLDKLLMGGAERSSTHESSQSEVCKSFGSEE
jgi:hypothetical protein